MGTQNSEKISTKGEGFSCEKCWAWTIQLLLWISIGWSFAGYFVVYRRSYYGGYYYNEEYVEMFSPVSFIYIIYVITNLCSSTFSYLRHTSEGNNIYNYMSKLFYSPTNIDFNISCFHYEESYYRNRNGYVNRNRHRRTTFNATESFQYFTWRDISGAFNLENSTKTLIKLHLTYENEFAQDGTQDDFNNQKNHFLSKYMHRDYYYDFYQTNRFDGFNEFNLITLGKGMPCGVCPWIFVVCTFLGFAELYKCYVDSHCSTQEFKIHKLLSTRTNFNIEHNFAPWEQRSPQVIFGGNTTTFSDPSRLGQPTEVPHLPTIDDIKEQNLGDDNENQPLNGNQNMNNDPTVTTPSYNTFGNNQQQFQQQQGQQQQFQQQQGQQQQFQQQQGQQQLGQQQQFQQQQFQQQQGQQQQGQQQQFQQQV